MIQGNDGRFCFASFAVGSCLFGWTHLHRCWYFSSLVGGVSAVVLLFIAPKLTASHRVAWAVLDNTPCAQPHRMLVCTYGRADTGTARSTRRRFFNICPPSKNAPLDTQQQKLTVEPPRPRVADGSHGARPCRSSGRLVADAVAIPGGEGGGWGAAGSGGQRRQAGGRGNAQTASPGGVARARAEGGRCPRYQGTG